MKQLLTILTSIALTSGCSTPLQETSPEAIQPEAYSIQAVMIELPTALATNAFPQPMYAQDASQLPSAANPEQPPLSMIENKLDQPGFSGQYGDMTGPMKSFTDAQDMSSYLENLMEQPLAQVTKLPTARLTLGERYIEDATKTVELPDDFAVVDGQTVVTSTGTFRTGYSIDIHLLKTDTSTATYQLQFFVGRLKGFEHYTLSNGEEISMPFWESRSINTELTQPVGYWFTPGGLTSELSEDDQTTSITQVFGIRILPAEQGKVADEH